MRQIEFFFDCSSPWTYLAFSRVEAIAVRNDATIMWKPILVGGVFNAVNKEVYERRANPDPRKASYVAKDMADWARLCGITIKWPPTIFPVRSVAAMRGAFHALDEGRLVPYASNVFRAYWEEDRDIANPAVLKDCAVRAGLAGDRFLASLDDPANKARLKASTDELIARGGFGSPTIFVNGSDMYFGNDRLVLVEAALMRLS